MEKERQERLEKERKEKEKLERERQERLEKERKEKEKLERERQEKLEKERQEKERLERERREREKQERLEKERKEKLKEIDTAQTESKKNKKRFIANQKGEEEEEDSSIINPLPAEYGPNKKKKFIKYLQTQDDTTNNETKFPKKNLFLSQSQDFKSKEILRESRKEDYKILLPERLTKGKLEEESELSSYKDKKKMNIKIDDDNGSNGQIASEYHSSEDNRYETYKKKKNKKYYLEKEEENINVGEKKKKHLFRHEGSLKSNLSESYLFGKGMPVKIKIYKCVIWKNVNPNVNTDTIKRILNRSGSQILKKGGFVVKLPIKNIKNNED